MTEEQQKCRQDTFVALNKYLESPDVNIKIIFSFDDISKADFENSIFFFHATWSGQSVIHLNAFFTKLTHKKPTRTKVFLVNIDCVTIEFIQKILGEKSHGWGEGIFYKEQSVISRQTGKNNFDEFLLTIEKNAD